MILKPLLLLLACWPILADTLLIEGDVHRLDSGVNGPGVFQWYKDGQLIPGANQSTFTLYYVLEGDAGEYSVKWQYKAQSFIKSVDKVSYKPLINVVVKGNVVQLSANKPNSKIFFTMDGTEPSTNTTEYTKPFKFKRGFMLRACVGDTEMDSVRVQPTFSAKQLFSTQDP
jgi:hypothetical protein